MYIYILAYSEWECLPIASGAKQFYREQCSLNNNADLFIFLFLIYLVYLPQLPVIFLLFGCFSGGSSSCHAKANRLVRHTAHTNPNHADGNIARLAALLLPVVLCYVQ